MKTSILSHVAGLVTLSVALASLTLAPASPASAQQTAADREAAAIPEIPYETFTLDNGFRVIVHEDRKAPIVAVVVWYHVGSKNEKPGKTGFAHLFEHLMFQGSEHYDDEYFKPFERAGASTGRDVSGTTDPDRTAYYNSVPTPALDMALWMESDRMGHLLGAIDQAKLDEQRGVVQNEKRQGESQPYGVTWQLLTENTYPNEHPYSWTALGSMEDLDAASLEDVHEWFETYYGPNNAVLVLAGDIDVATAREKVEKYFGAIPPGPPIARHQMWIAPMEGEKRQLVQDRVAQARLYQAWNVPPWGSEEADLLILAASILSEGKTSRLYKRLVYDDQIATSVNASLVNKEIGGQFGIEATARPGQSLAEVENALAEELARFLEEGPTVEELDRARTRIRAAFVRGIERTGGHPYFGGRANVLAEHAVYGGDPGFYRVRYRRMLDAKPEQVHRVAREWLGEGRFVLEVHPFPELAAGEAMADRSTLPDPGPPPEPTFPDLQRGSLSNRLAVILAERHEVPLVEMRLVVDAGYAADQFAAPGTANLAMAMLDEGTESMDALEISERLAELGAELSAGSNLDVSTVALSALRDRLDPSLDLFADVVLRPSFSETDFQRLKQQTLASIQQEKVQPMAMAGRLLPALLYGEDHAYSNPLTGSGTTASVRGLSTQDLREFHETWFRPNNATLVAVGDITMDELLPRLERRFAGWEPGEVPEKNISAVEHRERSAVYLLDRPGSPQSMILAGHIAPPPNNPRELALQAMNEILGGTFTGRVNMNLREEKGWSYAALTALGDARGQRPFVVYAAVQTDRTKESIEELQRELEAIRGVEPVTPDELQKTKDHTTRNMGGRWETLGAVAGSIAEMVRFGLPDDYYDTYRDEVLRLELDDLNSVAAEVIKPERLVWVVVGDREKIEPGIRELELGEIRLIDADGNVIEGATAAGSE